MAAPEEARDATNPTRASPKTSPKTSLHTPADDLEANAKTHPYAAHHLNLEFEHYFHGPRDIHRHSKWPYFLRLHGSILPKMIVPLTFVGVWATLITTIHEFLHALGVNSVLLTVTGFVVGLSLSFRSTTAYERYIEGRKYWAQLLLASRNLARIIWVHTQERHAESAELGKKDLLGKLAALNLLNAFAVSLKHRLRFEPSVEYPDIAPLLSHLHVLAKDADQAALRERQHPFWKATAQYLGLSFAQPNPRKLFKQAKDNLGNTPLEVLTYLSAYLESIFQNKTLSIGANQGQAMNYLALLADALVGAERVVNTPLPIAYSISIAQITWAYVLMLPFQLVKPLSWVAIPATVIAGYIILGMAKIGRELENPFGQDVNDLPLDAFCHELANDIDAMTSSPAPVNEKWMEESSAQVLWPLSAVGFKGWEGKSVEEIRAALKVKAGSRDVDRERRNTLIVSEALTS